MFEQKRAGRPTTVNAQSIAMMWLFLRGFGAAPWAWLPLRYLIVDISITFAI